jgi:hypothetical protein
LALSFCVLSVLAPCVLAEPAATAVKKPAVIERKIFNPKKLPNPPPPLGKNEVAVCVASTRCAAIFDTETVAQRRTARGIEASVHIPRIAATVDLKITIWLPENANETVKEHEETHRMIVERVYANADKAALESARRCVGRTYTGVGATLDAAERDAVQKAQKELMQGYMARAGNVWARVNEIFDDITAHGTRSVPGVRKYVDARTGMQRAFEQYEREAAAKQASVR